MSETYKKNLEVIGYFMTFIYNVEAVTKIYALRHYYFKSNWNRFDFFIVIAADLSILIEFSDLGEEDVLTILTIIKAIRIMRILRLVRTNKQLRLLIDSLIAIIPSIMNVASLMLLMFFIFAVIGMNMFSGIIHQRQINAQSNFTSFGMSLVTLIRCATGENWNIIMTELTVTNQDLQLKKVLGEFDAQGQ